MTNNRSSPIIQRNTSHASQQKPSYSTRLQSSSPFRTPQRPSFRRNQHRRSVMSARMSPSPSLLKTPSTCRRTSSRVNKSSLGARTGGDRFIPSRRRMNIDVCRRVLLLDEENDKNIDNGNRQQHDNNRGTSTSQTSIDNQAQKEYTRQMFSSLCDVPLDSLDKNARPKGLFSFGNEIERLSSFNRSDSSMKQPHSVDPFSHDTLRFLHQLDRIDTSSAIPSRRTNRKIRSEPTSILDADGIINDFHLDLMSWSQDNILAIAIAERVYLWNAETKDVQILTTVDGIGNFVTSLSWCTMPGSTKYIAVGTNWHEVELWDAQTLKRVRTFHGHFGRVTSMSWNQQCLSSGANDELIMNHDIRCAADVISTYEGHEGAVCGLKWNEEGTALASGGDDNYLCIWDSAMSASHRGNGPGRITLDVAPRLCLTEHTAAVRALDWCPFKRGLLASGGGTDDGTIKLWNANNGVMMTSTETGTQVTDLLWNEHQRELCSSHGYPDHQLTLWKYGSGPSLTKVQEFTGHTFPVLGLAASPSGSTVASISGDETLRFWDIFGDAPSRPSSMIPMMGETTFGVPSIR